MRGVSRKRRIGDPGAYGGLRPGVNDCERDGGIFFFFFFWNYLSALYDDERRRTAMSWDAPSSGERFAVSMMLPLKYSLSSTIFAR